MTGYPYVLRSRFRGKLVDPAAYIEMADVESRHWWFTGRRAILTSTIEQLKLPRETRILEIGCGTGGNLDMLAGFGTVSAFEMDTGAHAIASLKTSGTCDIRLGYCPDHIPFKEERFDLICMFDVLEHIQEDTETLTAVRSLLSENGRLLVTVPAYPWMYGVHDRFLHHKRRYSARELQQKITASGFRSKRMSYFNTILFPLAAIVRAKERLSGSSTSTGGNIPPRVINTLFSGLFCAEKGWLKYFNFPFGLSLICVLEPDPNAITTSR